MHPIELAEHIAVAKLPPVLLTRLTEDDWDKTKVLLAGLIEAIQCLLCFPQVGRAPSVVTQEDRASLAIGKRCRDPLNEALSYGHSKSIQEVRYPELDFQSFCYIANQLTIVAVVRKEDVALDLRERLRVRGRHVLCVWAAGFRRKRCGHDGGAQRQSLAKNPSRKRERTATNVSCPTLRPRERISSSAAVSSSGI